jgi:small subunit ribosomal protein S16
MPGSTYPGAFDVVKLRLKRFGRRHLPVYRLNAMDARTPRDGSPIEELGFYDPCEQDLTKGLKLKEERIKHWLSVGAQPTESVRDLLAKAGLIQKKPAKSAPAAAAAAAAPASAPAASA